MEHKTEQAVERDLRGLRLMALSRAIDNQCGLWLQDGLEVPNYHGARGQEALYAGVGLALDAADTLLYNYRAFATLLAKGVDLGELLADLRMLGGGTTSGHGGIMHVTKPSVGVPGRNGVFGSKFGIALGLAVAAKLAGRPAAVVCMFGEAEGNRGALYEAVNIACLQRLPVLFVAENNGYAVAAPTATLYATGDMSTGLSGFPMPAEKIDGNDLQTVYETSDALLRRIRTGAGPALIECVTYRLDPHHAHDDDRRYRDQAELDKATEAEPIRRHVAALRASGISQPRIERTIATADDEVTHAAASLEAPAPAVDGVLDFITYAPQEKVS